MTTITLPRATVEQALEALNVYASKAEHRRTYADDCAAEDAITSLRAALAQQAESPCACWPGRMCSRQAQCAATVRAQQAEPVASLNAWAEQRLARHGIPMPETPRCHYPNCVGGKQGTICHDSCPGGNPSFG